MISARSSRHCGKPCASHQGASSSTYSLYESIQLTAG